VAILEFFRPEKARFFFDKIYNAHVLPLLGWAVTGDREAYRYLPASIEKFASLGEFGDVLRGAGFATVEGKAAVSVGRGLAGGGVMKLVVAVGGASGFDLRQAAAGHSGHALWKSRGRAGRR